VAFRPDGKAILTVSQDQVRSWKISELPNDLPRMAAWIETITGLELNERSSLHVLDPAAWLQRRDRLGQLGGPP
jgi:hypothetical protein